MAQPIGGVDTTQMAAEATGHGIGGKAMAIVSALALISAISLYETVLKQPQLTLYLGETISYTVDPWGTHDVMVVPLTIANSGARDGSVITLRMTVTRLADGKSEVFSSGYFADASWFGTADNIENGVRRPKLAFAPLAVAGRSAYSGTILFYPRTPRAPLNGKADLFLSPKMDVKVRLELLVANAERSWIDRLLTSPVVPVEFTAKVPNYFLGGLLTGDLARLDINTADPIAPSAQ